MQKIISEQELMDSVEPELKHRYQYWTQTRDGEGYCKSYIDLIYQLSERGIRMEDLCSLRVEASQ